MSNSRLGNDFITVIAHVVFIILIDVFISTIHLLNTFSQQWISFSVDYKL